MLKTSLMLLTVVVSQIFNPAQVHAQMTPQEAREIAREAYIYGFPMVDNYRINYAYFVDTEGAEFKAPWNQIHNTARVYTPDDKAIQTPNSDTPYSQLGMDLRAEPLVVSVPNIEGNRYFSVQLIDGYTFNFAYIGSRATGNGGGNFLIAGPQWQGETPPGIDKVFRSGTSLAWALFRTQLFSPDDLKAVEAIQSGYKIQTLSQFLGKPATPEPAVSFLEPHTADEQRTSPDFFNVLAFVLQFAPVDASETELRNRFARLGIIPGKPFDFSSLPAEIQSAIKQGMADAWVQFAAFKKDKIDTLEVTSGDLFGTREFLKNNYLYRMAGAVLGIYGNSREEAMYPAYTVDASGAPLDGSKNSYVIRFAASELPPVNAFWSLTLYELPSSLLHANPINRYLINSPMLADLKRDADGGVTFYVSNTSPGANLEFELASGARRTILGDTAPVLAKSGGTQRAVEAANDTGCGCGRQPRYVGCNARKLHSRRNRSQLSQYRETRRRRKHVLSFPESNAA